MFICPSELATKNLKKEGIISGVYNVGDVLRDLVMHLKNNEIISEKLTIKNYYYVTLYRPYNADDKERQSFVLCSLNRLPLKVVMAIHPRTNNLMNIFGIQKERYENISFIGPQSYFDNLAYLNNCEGLITDSGGMQKEAYWLEKRYVTVSNETEWVETLKNGNNKLVFANLSIIQKAFDQTNLLWDYNLYRKANASEKTVKKIIEYLL